MMIEIIIVLCIACLLLLIIPIIVILIFIRQMLKDEQDGWKDAIFDGENWVTK